MAMRIVDSARSVRIDRYKDWPPLPEGGYLIGRRLYPGDADALVSAYEANRSRSHLNRDTKAIREAAEKCRGYAFFKDPRDPETVVAFCCWKSGRLDLENAPNVLTTSGHPYFGYLYCATVVAGFSKDLMIQVIRFTQLHYAATAAKLEWRYKPIAGFFSDVSGFVHLRKGGFQIIDNENDPQLLAGRNRQYYHLLASVKNSFGDQDRPHGLAVGCYGIERIAEEYCRAHKAPLAISPDEFIRCYDPSSGRDQIFDTAIEIAAGNASILRRLGFASGG